MSFSDFILKLQEKPRHVRVVILWTSVGICMFALFVFWINTLDIGLQNKTVEQEAVGGEKPISEIKEEIPSLWQSLKAGAGDLFETVNKEAEKESSSVDTEAESQQEEEAPPASLP